MEPEEDQSYEITFHDHMSELFRRILIICLGTLFVGFVGFLLSNKLALLLYLIADLSTSAPSVHPHLTFTDKVLLAAILSLMACHHLLLNQLYAFISPGLYPHERRSFLVPLVWAQLTPIIAFGFLAIYCVAINRLSQPPLVELASIRGWLLRFYFVTALSAFLLALPRQKRNLTLSAFTCLCLVVLILPNHVFDTLVIALLELCFIMSVVDGIVLSIWSDSDVVKTVTAETYLGNYD